LQRKLLAAAKVLADATAKMLEAARQCASHPHDAHHQDSLMKAVKDLRTVTTHSLRELASAVRSESSTNQQQIQTRYAKKVLRPIS